MPVKGLINAGHKNAFLGPGLRAAMKLYLRRTLERLGTLLGNRWSELSVECDLGPIVESMVLNEGNYTVKWFYAAFIATAQECDASKAALYINSQAKKIFDAEIIPIASRLHKSTYI